MPKIKEIQLTKNHITKQIHSKTGLSVLYTEKLVESLILILKDLIKAKKTSIKNFGTFKIVNKKKRVGRNPKNKKTSFTRNK